MNQDEYNFLASEIKELESILSELPADRVIDRMSFEARLENAKRALSQINPALLPKKARLTFRGNPVFGSHGIAAEFASKASSAFTDAFAAIVAGISENLHYMGPIPDKQKNQLLITGTAIGSFGFEFELPSPPPPASENPAQSEMELGVVRNTQNTEIAMQKLETLFRIASEGSDDDLSELVDELHPRAVKKVAEFLGYVSEHEAWCGLEFNDSIFRFSGSGQVRNSAERLNGNNIKETTEAFPGHIAGALPVGRTFEFKLTDQNGILRGKVGPGIEDPNVLNREYLYKPVNITLNVVQVGQGCPRYTLAKLQDIKAIS
ncbi:MAG: hypothetical protein LBK99_03190 [Opitutaceae bacterium]|jgi:hypothetical protein|nr:hypothetical protein [Opitutaceae bacterium]